MRHQDWLALTWPVFNSYMLDIIEDLEQQAHQQYFGSDKLAAAWEQHRDEWE